jgi:hypothetical protein
MTVFDLNEYAGNPIVRPIPRRCVKSIKDLDPRHQGDVSSNDEGCVGMVVSSDDKTLLNDIIMKEAQAHPDCWIKFSLVTSPTSKNCGHGSPIINPRMSVQRFASYVQETTDQSEMPSRSGLHAILRALGEKQGFKPKNVEVEYMAIYENLYGKLTFLDLGGE